MALSEHEERILAEIERSLADEDPQFVQRARRVSSRESHARQLRWSVVAFVLGLLSLLGLTFHFAFGVVGFLVMLVAAVVGGRAIAAIGTPSADQLVNRLRGGSNSRD